MWWEEFFTSFFHFLFSSFTFFLGMTPVTLFSPCHHHSLVNYHNVLTCSVKPLGESGESKCVSLPEQL
jgi:hypothetical protein